MASGGSGVGVIKYSHFPVKGCRSVFRFFKKQWLAISIVVLAIVIFAVMWWHSPTPKSTEVTQKPIPVKAKVIKLGSNQPQILLYGVIESTQLSRQRAKFPGSVVLVAVKEGEAVKKGQLMVQLSKTNRQHILQQRKAEYKDVKEQIEVEKEQYLTDKAALEHERKMVQVYKKDFARMQQLARQKYVSSSELERAESEHAKMRLLITQREHSLKSHEHTLAQLHAKLERADALVKLADHELTDADFKAPFDGRVNDMFVSVGTRVSTGQVVVEVLSDSGYRIRATLPNRDLVKVKQAMSQSSEVMATVKWHDNFAKAKLRAISTNIDKGQISKDALFVLHNEFLHWILGQTVSVYVPCLPIDDTILLPMTALHQNSAVYKIVDGHLKRVTVKQVGDVFRKDGSHDILVTSQALKSGDKVMVSVLPQAINGLAVNVISD